MSATFATLDAIKREKLHGRSPEGRWTIRRYDIELHANNLGSWTATIRDWKLAGGVAPAGEARLVDGIGIGIDADPDKALVAAMQLLGIVCRE